MESQFREIVRQRIVDALAARSPALTREDVGLPAVPGKAVAVIGMRRAGKTTFLSGRYWRIVCPGELTGKGCCI